MIIFCSFYIFLRLCERKIYRERILAAKGPRWNHKGRFFVTFLSFCNFYVPI